MSVQGRPMYVRKAGTTFTSLHDYTDTAEGTPIAISRPALLHHLFFVNFAAITVTEPDVTINHTLVGGAALTPDGDDAIGSFTVPTSQFAIGQGVRINASDFVRTPSNFGSDSLLVLPGEQILFKTGQTATTGTAVVFAHFTLLPMQNSGFFRSSDMGNPYEITTPADVELLQHMERQSFTGVAL